MMRNFIKSLVQIFFLVCVSYFALLAINTKTALFPVSFAALLIVITAWLIRKNFTLISFLHNICWIRLCVLFFVMLIPFVRSPRIIEYSWALPMIFGLTLLAEAIAMRIQQSTTQQDKLKK
jgi:hypothetical protein